MDSVKPKAGLLAGLLLLLMLLLQPFCVLAARPAHRSLICWFNCSPSPTPTLTYPKVTSKSFVTTAKVSSSSSSGSNTINGKAYTTVVSANTFSLAVQIVSAKVNGQSFSPSTFSGALGSTTANVNLEQSPLVWSSAPEGTFATAPGTYTTADVTTACFALQLTQSTTTNTAIFSTCP